MTAKQAPGIYAPDGSLYITLTDGAGNLTTVGSSSGLTVGTTTITSGTDTKVLFDNAGVLGELTVTGSGKAVLDTSPTISGLTTTGTFTTATVVASGTYTGSGDFRLANNLNFIIRDNTAANGFLASVASNNVGQFLFYPATSSFSIGTVSTSSINFQTNNTNRGKLTAVGNWVFATAALGTTATDGFIYLPTCAGAPTGTPTANTGTVAHVYDTTNNKLYVYNGGWKGVVLS